MMKELVATFYSDDPKYIRNAKTARQKAMEAELEYGRILVERGMNDDYGVTIEPYRHGGRRTTGWALYVESYDNKPVTSHH